MVYRVEITSRAERDLTLLYLQINAGNSQAASRWYFGLRESISSLRELPSRNPTTPQNKRLRHLLYGRKPNVYRVIFRVMNKLPTVQVLHIRHGARRRFRVIDFE